MKITVTCFGNGIKGSNKRKFFIRKRIDLNFWSVKEVLEDTFVLITKQGQSNFMADCNGCSGWYLSG